MKNTKKLLLVSLLIIFSVISFGENIIKIQEARKLKDLSTVTVQGVVTAEPIIFDRNIILIQDDTAGINVYSQKLDLSKLNITRGDFVQITGYLYTHRANLELVIDPDNPKYSIKILKNNQPLPEPKVIKTNDINNNDIEGLLIKTKGKIVKIDPPKIFINDGSGDGMVYIRENTGIDSSIYKEGIEIEVTGLLGQYGSDSELWPRTIEDIKSPDLIPPQLKVISFDTQKSFYVLFSEPVKKLEANKTIKVLGNNISSITELANGSMLYIKTDSPVKGQKLAISPLIDLSGNMLPQVFKPVDYTTNAKVHNVIFDQGHGQKAGNADWTIDTGYSKFGDLISELNMMPYSLNNFKDETTLNLFGIMIIPEPNSPYTPEEEKNILNFVKNGGGLFIISDHGNSDRNGDGWDSVSILNRIVPEFGFKFAGDDLGREAPLKNILPHEITKNIKNIGVWNGSSIEITGKNITKLITTADNKTFMIVTKYGKGFIVAIGDSSPFDDGEGTVGKTLYDGWTWGDDALLAENVIKFFIKNLK